ncbi:hypothetical protein FRC07_000426 [Ceratobasidium sp. 392]|nr:hypothetical protein FRC07_000426 [Ceratobasidium sp. 392]
MFDNLRGSLRRVKDAVRSRSRSRTPTPAPTNPGAGPPIQAAALTTPEAHTSAHSAHTTIPSIVVSPLPDAQDPGPALTPSAPPAGEQSAKHHAWAGLRRLLGVLRKSSEAFGPLTAAIGVLSEWTEHFEQAERSREDYKELTDDLDALFNDLSGYLGGSAPPAMTPIIENIARSISREVNVTLEKQRRNSLGRFVRATEDADQILESYRRLQTLLRRLTLNANMSVWKNIDEQTTELRLGKLLNAPTAMYRSTASDSLRRVGCTPNTRVDVIEQLLSWACDSASEKVYWLNGMAGTGKTTIAYTLCDQLQRTQQLGASFFCTRQLPECRDVNKIVPSIAFQLSLFSLPFRHALSEVLEQNKSIHDQPLRDQFEQLVVAPLEKVAHTFAADVIVVVDALDECEDKDGVDRMLGALLSLAPDLAVRFFVTSRPEPKILDQMRSRQNGSRRSELRLHELDRTVVQQDITTYLGDKLRRARVSDAHIEEIAKRSGVLFIYAATVVRYIEYDNFFWSSQRLRTVLGTTSEPNGSDKDIDKLYATILSAAFDEPALEVSERAKMRDLLSHVVCAQEPLSVDAIAGLLGLDDATVVQAALRPLLSVLNVSSATGLVTTLHESFPNYMLNPQRSENLYCDARQHHARMARICFDLIKIPNPPFNICKLESSYRFDNEVPDIDERVNMAISKGLTYACRYWGAHLELGETTGDLVGSVYELLSVRLLLWMEVMNLKKLMGEGAKVLHGIQTWCEVGYPYPVAS